MSGRLAHRRILVTGGGRGLGRAIALAAATEGAAVGLVGRTAQALEGTADEARSHGVHAAAAAADVSDAAAVEAAVAELGEALGGLDGLVTAAAVDCAWAPTAEMDLGEWDRTIAINLSGAFYCCRFALPHLVAAGSGAIVNISSIAGERAWAEDVAYNASKAGVELLTRTIAVEYADRGVRANCLAPGVIDAGMTDELPDGEERERLRRLHPAGRFGTAGEVAEAAVWLLSDAASFTTGATLRVDGGFLA
ncbi:MAG TPA: SDR family NAD(P)-dependent oxidoreductase [Thermoleophilaceae bacterium]|nr:SDR family NAD(P)-dependent oxidoreductase [Thermoleophilaceae bacterium]